MKLLTKAIAAVLMCVVLLHAFPDEGDKAEDFTIYNYNTESDWTLFDHIGKNVIFLVSGSYC